MDEWGDLTPSVAADPVMGAALQQEMGYQQMGYQEMGYRKPDSGHQWIK